MSKKVLVVGGVAGGATTVARLRRLDENLEIILFERGEYISFANCGLPYYIGGTIEERDALLVQTPESMEKRFNIDVRIKNEVTKILKDEKKIEVKDLSTGKIYEESYDYLVLSPGSTPLRPPIPGIDSPNIFSLWNIPDTDAIYGFIKENCPKKAVVVGGGFIGLEMAENLHELGIEVSIVEMLDQVMAPLDFEMAEIIHEHIKSKGGNLYLGDGVQTFDYKDGKTTITLQSGKTIETDLVILSIGIRPNGELAKDAGLEVNQRGGIVVDKNLRTSDKNIFAIGDAIEVIDFVNKTKTMVPLAGPANKQGRIVANNIVGRKEEYKGTQGTSVAKVFDMTVASTGNNEKTLNKLGKEYGKDYLISFIHAKSHAGYYPEALPITIKLIFDLEGKILGAQSVGYDGVDKRIDVIATAIRFGGTIYDLKELELAYAPPYSSAKDPVNMAGYVAENILNKDVDTIFWNELDDLDRENSIILDVTDPEEREMGYVEGSINIPLNDLRDRLDELDKDKLIVPYCGIGIRGYIASRILVQNGFKAKNFAGGFMTYGNLFCKDENDCGGRIQSENIEYTDHGEIKVIGNEDDSRKTLKINISELTCPTPSKEINEAIEKIDDGDILEILSSDPNFSERMKTWCSNTRNTFVKGERVDKGFLVTVKKGLNK
ncbi:pyridine nucleotide-disulfide oxidoreductase [Anaerosalibacter bizertensis]|uniref:Pyridine nucleotide-disulfide oxidoreductase n=1 Tax=Anaerosalibacter bizertensis TaxID=932217 RepID=A0A844FE82_9FIRM|nr:FAD-dependent oxidoreductase [Anaerosalibacter bizertensis]MSS42303.1 pyridine nucleotide-disulfide oxidoreductase [Anaerosalibacter bizertensis]